MEPSNGALKKIGLLLAGLLLLAATNAGLAWSLLSDRSLEPLHHTVLRTRAILHRLFEDMAAMAAGRAVRRESLRVLITVTDRSIRVIRHGGDPIPISMRGEPTCASCHTDRSARTTSGPIASWPKDLPDAPLAAVEGDWEQFHSMTRSLAWGSKEMARFLEQRGWQLLRSFDEVERVISVLERRLAARAALGSNIIFWGDLAVLVLVLFLVWRLIYRPTTQLIQATRDRDPSR